MKKEKKSKVRYSAFIIILATTLCVMSMSGCVFRGGNADYFKFAKDFFAKVSNREVVQAIKVSFIPADENTIPTAEQLESARAIFETRLDSEGILDYTITTDSENHAVIVEFPWKSDEKDYDPQKAIDELGETANLTFCSLKKDSSGNPVDAENVSITTSGNAPAPDKVLLSGKDIKSATAVYQEGKYLVALEFTAEGAKAFKEATTTYLNDFIGIYLDDVAISWPIVNSVIDNGEAVIEGGFDSETAQDLANKINAGALPYKMISYILTEK